MVIAEDFPKEINQKRKELYPAMMAAKTMEKKAHLKVDKLVVNGKVCSDQEVKDLLHVAEQNKKKRPIQTTSPDESNQPQKVRQIQAGSSRERSASLGRQGIEQFVQKTPAQGFFDIKPLELEKKENLLNSKLSHIMFMV